MLGRIYCPSMCLARLRGFAWIMVLVLTAGLATPVLASTFEQAARTVAPVPHVHADGSVHAHAVPRAADTPQVVETRVLPAKAPLHCPGCATAAECAVSCLGLGVLPASVLMSGQQMPQGWMLAALAEPTGTAPFGDIDPPRPVSVR